MREKYSTLAAILICLLLASGCGRGKAAVSRPQDGAKPGAAPAKAAPMAPAGGSKPAAMDQPAANPEATAAGKAAQGSAPGLPAPIQAEAGNEDGAARASPPLLPPQLANSRSFGLMAPAGPILPEDPELGSLQDYRPKDKAELAALGCARAFLDGLVKGEVAAGSVDPAKADLISLLAADVLEAPHPSSYRLGAIAAVGRDAARGRDAVRDPVVKFRLNYEGFGKEGELGLRFRDGAWYVESVSIESAVAPSR